SQRSTQPSTRPSSSSLARSAVAQQLAPRSTGSYQSAQPSVSSLESHSTLRSAVPAFDARSAGGRSSPAPSLADMGGVSRQGSERTQYSSLAGGSMLRSAAPDRSAVQSRASSSWSALSAPAEHAEATGSAFGSQQPSQLPVLGR